MSTSQAALSLAIVALLLFKFVDIDEALETQSFSPSHLNRMMVMFQILTSACLLLLTFAKTVSILLLAHVATLAVMALLSLQK